MADDLDLETLCQFVSPAIFEFLASVPSDVDVVSTSAMNKENFEPVFDDYNGSEVEPQQFPLLLAFDDLDAHVDTLLFACSSQFEEEELTLFAPKRARVSHTPNKESSSKQVFGAPKTEQEIAKAKLGAVPDATLVDTNYCVRIWKEWCDHRSAEYGNIIPCLEDITVPELASHLSNFVFEIRKKTGEEFPRKSLHHIVCGVQRHIRMSGRSSIDVFKDSEFADFRVYLDAEMKRLQKEGHGSKTKKLLWEKRATRQEHPSSIS